MFEELEVFFVGIKDSPGAFGGLKKRKIVINFFVIKCFHFEDITVVPYLYHQLAASS
jgi:hypothetical protein